jgi:simple sugar transport system substrate-binding protein
MFGLTKKRVLFGVAAGLVLVTTAACSSSGGAQKDSTAAAASGSEAASGGGAVADTPRYTFAMISHAPAGDTFFDVIQKGATDAAAKDNVEFKYSGSGSVPEQANLIQNAIDSKVDGIAVSMPDPAALSEPIKKAVDAGIPVVIYNAGDRDWQKTGALSFFGEPEVLAGEFAGTKLNEIGSKHTLCVTQAQGQIQLEDRCDGITSKFSGTTDRLFSDGTDPAGYVSTIQAKLASDPTIDSVVTLGPQLGVALSNALKDAGSTVKVATYAFNADAVPLLQSGQLAFTIDQQPWLQGYMAIDSLWQYKKNNSVLGAQLSTPTGPVVYDKDNIGSIVPFINEGLR